MFCWEVKWASFLQYKCIFFRSRWARSRGYADANANPPTITLEGIFCLTFIYFCMYAILQQLITTDKRLLIKTCEVLFNWTQPEVENLNLRKTMKYSQACQLCASREPMLAWTHSLSPPCENSNSHWLFLYSPVLTPDCSGQSSNDYSMLQSLSHYR